MKETNMEHYRNEILEISKKGFGIALEKNQLVPCAEIACSNCGFDDVNCTAQAILWMMADYTPEITLTAREKGFVECVDYGWIARDADQDLCWYEMKPDKTEEAEIWEAAFSDMVDLNSEYFSFIKWEDEEPWAVEDLRKLKALEYNPEDVAFKGGDLNE